MNGTVKRIVEILFQDTEMTEEVQAIRDELMDNCQQRYEDLIGQGRSEDEAIAMVIESLKGMEEVIGAYPRSRSAEAREEQDGEHDRTMLFPAAQVKHVEVNLLYQDVSFVPGLGEHVIVHVEGKEEARVDVRLTGDTLRIMRAEESLGKGGRWWDRLFCISWSECVRVEVPVTCWCGLTAHCTSGDLSVQNVIFQQVHMEAMSGDISVRNDTMGFSQELILKSTSGDIRVEYNAKRMELQSMSGDVTVDADAVLVPDIYPGREKDTGLVHARDMVGAIEAQGTEAHYLPTFADIRAARPSQAEARRILAQYLENIKFANCRPQTSYIKSIGLKAE